MLEIKNLNVHYGVIHALKDVSLTVNKGEIVTLIGANGAKWCWENYNTANNLRS